MLSSKISFQTFSCFEDWKIYRIIKMKNQDKIKFASSHVKSPNEFNPNVIYSIKRQIWRDHFLVCYIKRKIQIVFTFN